MALTNDQITAQNFKDFYTALLPYLGADTMPYEDMAEIVTPLPTVKSGQLRYSLEEQLIGEWVGGKKLYQKTFDCGELPNASSKNIPHNISNLDVVCKAFGVAYNSSNGTLPLPFASTSDTKVVELSITSSDITLTTAEDRSAFSNSYVTLQYTKTTV